MIARVQLMMLVAAQFGDCDVFTELNNLNLCKNNKMHVNMFTGTMVTAEFVSMMTLLLIRERQEIVQLPMWIQRWVLTVLSILAPKDIYRLDNFGMIVSKKSDILTIGTDVKKKNTKKNPVSKVLSGKEVLTKDFEDDEDDEGKYYIKNIINSHI
jgi:hypothetical protein